METRRKKIGIMGGTFDPIHIGHLILGEKTYEQLGLDKILFMPAGNPPHKQNRIGRATDAQRVSMVEKAISGNPHFELSLTEMNDKGFTYTYHTLETLKEQNPDTDISSQLLRKWHQEGKSLRYYVPDAVADYIDKNHIYHITEGVGHNNV